MATDTQQLSQQQQAERDMVDKFDSGTQFIWGILGGGDEGRHERNIKLSVAGANKALPEDQRTPEMQRRYPGMEASDGEPMDVLCWDPVNGAEWERGVAANERTTVGMEGAIKALQMIPTSRIPRDTVIIMKDLHTLLNHHSQIGLRRCLVEMCKGNSFNNPEMMRPIIVLSDDPHPHPQIRDYVSPIEFGLPDESQIRREVVDWTQDSIRRSNPDHPETADCDDDLKDKITQQLLGLGAEEGQRILGFASTQCGGLNDRVLPVISREKMAAINAVEGLEFVPYDRIINSEDIGGYDGLLDYGYKRRMLYLPHARSLGLPRPRGIALVGCAGTGKTTVGMLMAKVLGLDLIQLDPSSLMDSLVGGTEKKTRAVFAMVRAMRRCVLMVDELDKVMGGAHENQKTDSGVSSRMLSYFLRFLSERDMTGDDQIFVVITMNRVEGMPPELLRPGRLDRVFTTRLPSKSELLDILKIQLRLNGLDHATYGKSLSSVTTAMKDYSGAEVREVVIAARTNAYYDAMTAWEQAGSQGAAPDASAVAPSLEHLVSATAELTPLATIMEKEVKAMHEWCEGHGTPVSGQRTSSAADKRNPSRVKTSARGGDASNN